MKQSIQTAKRIYTETQIGRNQVSVVSLAFQQLLSVTDDKDSRILVVGAGVTNLNLCKLMKDSGFNQFAVFNRNPANAQALAEIIGGKSYPLTELSNYKEGFDILITCTASSESIIDTKLYENLLMGAKDQKIIIDLAVPADTHSEVMKQFDVNYISVESLKILSEKNMLERRKELIAVRQLIYDSLEEFKRIFRLRQVALRMKEVPEKVREIRTRAVNEVFSKEIDQLDPGSKAVLEKVLNYMEKKYVSVPMIVAKQFVDEKEIE